MELENRLVEGEWVSAAQLERAREEAAAASNSLWFSLMKLGYLTEEEIMKFFSCESGIPYVNVSDYRYDAHLLRLMGADFCVQNLVFPLFSVGRRLYVACSNPFNSSVLDSLARMSGMDVEPLIASADSILRAQDSYWRFDERIFEATKYLTGKKKRLLGVSLSRSSERIPLNVPVSIWPQGPSFRLSVPGSISASTRDITADGNAICCVAGVFLPPQLACGLLFNISTGDFKIDGTVANCRIEKSGEYYIGIQFNNINAQEKKVLLSLVKT